MTPPTGTNPAQERITVSWLPPGEPSTPDPRGTATAPDATRTTGTQSSRESTCVASRGTYIYLKHENATLKTSESRE